MTLTHSQSTQALLTIAAVVVILAGIRLSSDIISPLLLAYFISMMLNPVISGLERLYLPRALGVLLVISLLVLLCASLMGMAGHAAQEFSRVLPGYRQDLLEMITRFQGSLLKRGITVDFSTLFNTLDTQWLFNLATSLFSRMSSVTSYVVVILLTVVFMLFEVPLLQGKLQRALPDPERQLLDVERFVSSVNRYVVLKSILSAITGLSVAVMLQMKGVQFYVLAGLVAFFLNFIPNIGSIIAAIPGILITLLQQSPGDAALVAAGYVAINMVIGNLVEPRVLGKGLGLSSLVVFLSLVFWGWLLGPIGMLLSVPLTMCIKILLESSHHNGLAQLLGAGDDISNLQEA
ncbi:AI-2E family transporter [Endozoicomonas gorgoniicola]|uniref:AI-2E family transporter n=1 Tax=Endozoicomonas gorgoniicola TaxID=1234144 RepID=A0ABT3MXJ6_9GAMM|nr:AI-2E family transporter [Endozoicomonas gorgoniicola]MCW7554103.1 AI-2E family transporter [Endozoicomonas gorgoniicola]